jgi:peptidyl-prolyl cis-trans isomerase D
MLQAMRKTANSLVVRIFLFTIIASFIVWGIGDVLRHTNDFDVISFKYAKNVPFSEFIRAKTDIISNIQKESDTPLTEEKIAQLMINEKAIENIVNNRMIEDWVARQDIIISDAMVANYIKAVPNFQNENKEFDFEKFKRYLSASGQSERQVYDAWKLDIASNTLYNSVLSNIVLPPKMVEAVSSYMAEKRIVDIVSIDLKNGLSKKNIKYSDEDLQTFFNSHQDTFQHPEVRNIRYFIMHNDTFDSQISVTDQEAEAYFAANTPSGNNLKPQAESNVDHDAIDHDAFNSVRSEIIQQIKDDKRKNLINDIIKQIEDEVASGISVDEIAKRNNFSLMNAELVFGEINIDDKLMQVMDSVFSMRESEVSYPLDIDLGNGQAGFIVLEVDKILESKVPDFSTVRDDVIQAYKKESLMRDNLDMMQKFRNEVNADNFLEVAREYANDAKEYKFQIHEAQSMKRSEMAINFATFPGDMVHGIFNTNVGSLTSVTHNDTHAYVACLRDISIDEEQAATFLSQSKDNINTHVGSEFINEILRYFYNINKPEVKIDLIK